MRKFIRRIYRAFVPFKVRPDPYDQRKLHTPKQVMDAILKFDLVVCRGFRGKHGHISQQVIYRALEHYKDMCKIVK